MSEQIIADGIVIVNPGDRDWTKGRFLVSIGCPWSRHYLVWASSYEDAIDEVVDHVAEYAPSLLANDIVEEEYQRAITEGLGHDEAYERATEDVICAGNAGDYLLSYEVAMTKDPSRSYLKRLQRKEG